MFLIRMQLLLVAHTRPTVLAHNSPQKQHKRERKPSGTVQKKLFEGGQSQQHILQSKSDIVWGETPSVNPSKSKPQILFNVQRKLRRGMKCSQQLDHFAGLHIPALSWAVVCPLPGSCPFSPNLFYELFTSVTRNTPHVELAVVWKESVWGQRD